MHVKTEKAAGATGIGGLDNILGGGFTPNRIYLIEGDPGSGKTTLALQYLLEGRRQGESGMYVSLSETKEELEGVARSHGWDLEGIHCHELLPSDESLLPDAQSRLFHPSEVELSDTTRAILMLERLLAAPAREKKRGPPVGGRTDPGEESINAIDRLS